MQLRIPFLPSERRKPCSAWALLDEDMIVVQSVGREIVTLQVVQVNVASCRNRFFGRTNRDTTLVYPLSGVNIADCDLVSDCNALREHNFASINDVAIPKHNGRDHDNHVIVAMNAQQLP